MNKVSIILIFLYFFISKTLIAQDIENYNLFLKFSGFYNSGDFINAEASMLSLLNSEKTLSNEYLVAAYNNLGVINMLICRYDKAIEYYNRAESLVISNYDLKALAAIYNNKAYILNIQKSFYPAIEYLEKCIRIYQSISRQDTSVQFSLTSAYINIAINYIEIKDYKSALRFLEKSSQIKTLYNLSGLSHVYLNVAKVYIKTNNPSKAEEYFLKSISGFTREFNEEYYKLAEVYFDYGLFLRSIGRNPESLEIHRNAISICLKNYSEKHTLISLSYKHIGDHYMIQRDIDSALNYYQKSLMAVVYDFNDPDIYSNPNIDSTLFDIRLLNNLKSKASALDLLSKQQSDFDLKLKTSQKSMETIELAIKLIERIRNNYLPEESRIYLAENEKETYIFAIQLAYNLYNLSKVDSTLLKIYEIARKSKSAVLRNEITGNELFLTSGIPDSIRKKKDNISANIAAYNYLITEELRKRDPDNQKISLWKDAMFEMNREKGNVVRLIDDKYPQYNQLLHKTQPTSLTEIQRQLSKDETVIDYVLSNQYSDRKRRMYIFAITKSTLDFIETDLDSVFIKNVDVIYRHNLNYTTSGKSSDSFRTYTEALYYMYDKLVKPVEGFFAGTRLVVIPDEEIAQLTFDAFLKSRPSQNQRDFEGLKYLINDYTISYRYFFSPNTWAEVPPRQGIRVSAFSPYYNNNSSNKMETNYLQGTGTEIDAIFKVFKGRKFTSKNATESGFREEIKKPAIFHLAMHSLSDSINSKYSYLLFDKTNDNENDGKLYNYEISTERIQSPMVVLSACNSGSGTLYFGEGVMSLARGFILAGASSVIKTAWNVNDETSSAIMKRFYFHLSKGKAKDGAMRMAKLEYIKANPPIYSDPYYWAAYEVLGNNSWIVRNNCGLILISSILAVFMIAGLLIYYFRRLSTFKDGAL